MLSKFVSRAPLDDADRDALLSLPHTEKVFQAGAYIVREGAAPTHCAMILDGFAYRQKLTQQGGRQIISFHIPGDFVDLEGSLLKVSDHNVQALTRCEVASIPISSILALMDKHP